MSFFPNLIQGVNVSLIQHYMFCCLTLVYTCACFRLDPVYKWAKRVNTSARRLAHWADAAHQLDRSLQVAHHHPQHDELWKRGETITVQQRARARYLTPSHQHIYVCKYNYWLTDACISVPLGWVFHQYHQYVLIIFNFWRLFINKIVFGIINIE